MDERTPLERVRDDWGPPEWKKHFESLGLNDAGKARYSTATSSTDDRSGAVINDVIRQGLYKLQNARCWFGSASCIGRAVPLREGQIDHVVEKKAKHETLEYALKISSIQKEYFDVHDPGNLAYICSACNQAKGDRFIGRGAYEKQLAASEKRRADLIRYVEKWHRNSKFDKSHLSLVNMLIDDDETRELYVDLAAMMIENVASLNGNRSSYYSGDPTSVESRTFKISVQLSDDLQFLLDQQVEMQIDEDKLRRAGY